MTTKKRIAQLEKTMPKAKPTWKDFITGAWKPNPQEWATFLANAKPSDIVTHAEKLIQQGYTPTADERASLDSMRLVTRKDGDE